MPFVQRRVFHGKIGKGDELIEHLQEGNLLARAQGVAIRPRLLSDFCSGRTDRVVMEWEAHSVQEIEAVLTEMWVYPESPELFEKWFARLAELIEYGEVDTWRVQ